MYAVIDVGSNTIRLTVYDVKNNDFKILFNQKIMAGLFGYVENNNITQEGIDVASNALYKFKSIVNNFNIENLFVFATASLRNINNTNDAINQIYNRTGINIEIISGEDEAILDFKGATHNIMDMNNGILIDIGGGSTEIVCYDNKKILNAISIHIGSLKLYKKYVNRIIPTKLECEKINKMCLKEIEKINKIKKQKYSVACGVGGTIRSLLKLNNFIFKLDSENRSISISNLKIIIEFLKCGNNDVINTILKVCPDRIHTIIPGSILFYNILKQYDCDVIIISEYGVREGYLYSRIIEKSNK